MFLRTIEPYWRGYGLACLATTIALIFRWLLNPILQGDSPYSIFILAVLISAWRGGLGPGLMSLGLSAALATFFFLTPQLSLAFGGVSEMTHFCLFATIGTLVCLLGHRMRSALARAERSEGEARRTVGELAQAITVREAVEDQLRQALETAETATQSKSAFMAYMSHEIRTPLNGVLGMLGLLGRTSLNDRQQHYAQQAKDSAELLLALLNDVLDYTKIELGRYELEEVAYQPAEVVFEVEAMFAGSAEQKGLKLLCRVDPELRGLEGRGDPARLRQILVNLVGNALKFTNRGEVVLSVALVDTGKAARSLRFEVRDTGIGIAPEGREKLFQPFSQADSSMSRRFGGSGLGLAISRNLVGLMHGSIDFESMPGQGSTFWFAIPFKPRATLSQERIKPAIEPEPVAAKPVDRSRRILVVEDNPISAEVSVTLLREAGYPCDLAETGIEALEKVSAHSYDLILMDCQLPDLDGFETTRRIRRRHSGPRPPILALTASVTPEIRARCQEAGMDACLAKPISVDTLLGAVARALEGAPVISRSVVDLTTALTRLGGNTALLAKLADQFLAGSDDLMNTLRSSIRDQDAATLGLIAHRLKGQAATFDAAIVVETASRLESLANDADWPRIQDEMARLEEAMPTFKMALGALKSTHSP